MEKEVIFEVDSEGVDFEQSELDHNVAFTRRRESAALHTLCS